MYTRSNTMFLQIAHKRLSVRRTYYILMPYMSTLSRYFRPSYNRITYFLVIELCQLVSPFIFSIDIRQFHTQKSSLHLIYATIYTLMLIDIAPATAVIGKIAYHLGHGSVRGSHNTCIAQRS